MQHPNLNSFLSGMNFCKMATHHTDVGAVCSSKSFHEELQRRQSHGMSLCSIASVMELQSLNVTHAALTSPEEEPVSINFQKLKSVFSRPEPKERIKRKSSRKQRQAASQKTQSKMEAAQANATKPDPDPMESPLQSNSDKPHPHRQKSACGHDRRHHHCSEGKNLLARLKSAKASGFFAKGFSFAI